MDCIVCFSEEGQTSCFSCEKTMCFDCLERFVDLSLKEKQIPQCWCGESVKFSDIIKTYNDNLVNDYKKLLFDRFNDDNYDEINAASTKNLILGRLRNEKTEFYKNLLGDGALMKMINYAYEKKLNMIQKNNIKKINETLVKKCFSELCKGKLDENHQCLVCTKKFCKKCEKKIQNDNHICSEEDLKTFEFMKTISQCPECKSYVEKSYGCNLMTCTACKTNFLYSTGVRINSGNNHNENFTLKKPKKLSEELRGRYSEMTINLLTRFENKEPPFLEKKFLYKIKNPDKFVRAYQQHRENFYKRKLYFELLEDVISKKEKITSDYLERILSKLE